VGVSKLRSIIVALLLLWLPFQTVAAVAMPFCEHGQAPANTDAPLSHDQHSGHHPAHAPDDSTSLFACTDCGACHLACAPMVGTGGSTSLLRFPDRFSALAQRLPPAHALEQPDPPPLA
jgi:hypothetical protein